MNDTNIDKLSIEIESSASKAVSEINKLSNALGRLGSVTFPRTLSKRITELTTSLSSIDGKAVSELSNLSTTISSLSGASKATINATLPKRITELAVSMSNINTQATSNLSKLSKAITALSGLNNVTINATLSKRIVELATALSEINVEKANNLSKLSVALSSLSGLDKTTISATLSKRISELILSISTIDIQTITGISNLSVAISSLSGLDKITISGTLSKRITEISTALTGINVADFSKIKDLTIALTPLETLGKANLTTFINQIGKLGQLAKELNIADLEKFAEVIKKVAIAMKPLADEMNKVANGFSSLPTKIQRIISSQDKLTNSNEKQGKSWNILSSSVAKFMLYANFFTRISRTIASFTKESNDYIENLNLFNVAMGEYAQQGLEYANQVSEALGIDVSDWIRNQGLIMDMSKSFGVATKDAYTMSKALTQLAYDYSSLYNLRIDESMEKIQSALAGEHFA